MKTDTKILLVVLVIAFAWYIKPPEMNEHCFKLDRYCDVLIYEMYGFSQACLNNPDVRPPELKTPRVRCYRPIRFGTLRIIGGVMWRYSSEGWVKVYPGTGQMEKVGKTWYAYDGEKWLQVTIQHDTGGGCGFDSPCLIDKRNYYLQQENKYRDLGDKHK